MKIRLAGTVNDSIVDGKGFRYTVFTQGCPHRCEGCHNPETHDFAGGYDGDTEEIIAEFSKNILLSGITLSGGEPFCQAEACCELAKRAKKIGLNVWAYTGYTFEQLTDGFGAHPEWKSLLENVDVLADGRFVLALRSLECKWRGSTNQRLIDVKASLAAGKAIDFQLDD
ncbi:MAG: anaerobic ribonucleoside-triphosphate reductase activating protein [Clostridia bacterium]|nr:anaerobic ribonucleoside-triphosphate reductase activating protein [Clostridia bacterium]